MRVRIDIEIIDITFSDVPNGKYYTKAIEWAYAKGVVSGKYAGEVSSYAVSSIQWAFNNGIMGGNGSLAPKSNCCRAEAATMMMNFANMFKYL